MTDSMDWPSCPAFVNSRQGTRITKLIVLVVYAVILSIFVCFGVVHVLYQSVFITFAVSVVISCVRVVLILILVVFFTHIVWYFSLVTGDTISFGKDTVFPSNYRICRT